jgi:hypothetical protein
MVAFNLLVKANDNLHLKLPEFLHDCRDKSRALKDGISLYQQPFLTIEKILEKT